MPIKEKPSGRLLNIRKLGPVRARSNSFLAYVKLLKSQLKTAAQALDFLLPATLVPCQLLDLVAGLVPVLFTDGQ